MVSIRVTTVHTQEIENHYNLEVSEDFKFQDTTKDDEILAMILNSVPKLRPVETYTFDNKDMSIVDVVETKNRNI